jgi:hypothetical protein
LPKFPIHFRSRSIALNSHENKAGAEVEVDAESAKTTTTDNDNTSLRTFPDDDASSLNLIYYFSAKHNDYLIVYFCVALDSLSWFRRFEPWRQTPKIKQA